ncbi:MAG: DUF2851 family protein [Brumimicrobium sp.]
MQEEYLHYLWRLKRLPLHNLTLTDGRTVEVHNTGWYNLDAGPDFFNGTVSLDGMRWSGNIELHVKSSDWYVHNHHHDKAYENVVLHVVYEHDKEVIVNGEKLPTLELKDIIDINHWRNYDRITSRPYEIACSAEMPIDNFIIEQQLSVSLFQRLERKGMELVNFLRDDQHDKKKALLIAVLQSFGGRANKLPMIELAHIIPLRIIAKEKWSIERIESIVFGCAGMLNNKKNRCDQYTKQLKIDWNHLKLKYNLPEMNVSSWKFSGMRPYSFPSIRLAQLSALLYHWNLSLSDPTDAEIIVAELNSKFQLPVSKYWENHFVLGSESNPHNAKISSNTFNLVLINGIVPYLIYLKHLEHNFEYSDAVINLLEHLPPESNNITKKWSNLGIKPKNAAESQGMIELKNEFCNFKKCLSCKIGHHVLETEVEYS